MISERPAQRRGDAWTRRAFVQAGTACLGAALAPFPSHRSALAQAGPEGRESGLAFASAREAARAIGRREVSSVELTELMLRRIERYDADVNAVVVRLFEQARARAREADEALARGQTWGPLHGVPITVKESYDVAGVPSTWGNPEFADNVPRVDATVVTRLRQAGAVLLGKTNVPFMLADWQSWNPVYGVTRNPWDLERTPGGSTGGGAAALAAGLSYLSVGSDLGGSIRVPAHFCGVFGHKSSRALVPRTGQTPPIPPTVLPELDANGPLARSAADLRLALEVLGGPDGEEAAAYRWTLPSARGTRLADYRIGYVLDHPRAAVSSDVKEVLSSAVEALRGAGARLEEGWPEGVDPVVDRDTYLYLLEVWIPWELDGNGVATPQAPHADVQSALTRQLVARAVWREYFRTHDAFLMPPFPITAFPHDHSGARLHERVYSTPEGPRRAPELVFWTTAANLLGLPATIAPVGLTAGGLPVGIQVLGPYLEDSTPIAVAGHVAEVTGGFRPPDGYREAPIATPG